MNLPDWIAVFNILGTVLAILAAPLVALWIGGKLQIKTDEKKAKLALLSTLISLRHDSLSDETVRALNSIDVVFVDEPAVREAWSRYFVAINDTNLQNATGYSIREERRRDLLLEIVKALKLSNKISTTDLIRAYTPYVAAEKGYVGALERLQKIAALQEDLTRRQIPFPPNPAPWNVGLPVAPQTTEPSAATIAAPRTPIAADDGDQTSASNSGSPRS